MKTIQLPTSSLSAFYTLVEEARQLSMSRVNDELQSYLVLLLMQWVKSPQIADNIFALDFLENIKKTRTANLQVLREIGDKCLIFSGLFPGNARRRLVNVSYYVQLGQNAYLTLSRHSHDKLSELYEKLGQNFVPLMDILHTIREMDRKGNALDLLEAEDLWNKTHSDHALKILRTATQGFFIAQANDDSLATQAH
jgi:hypothetical protein